MAMIHDSDAQSLTKAIAHVVEAVEETLAAVLPTADGEGPEATLFKAMRYATLGGGKRLRPFLVVATAALFDVPEEVSLRVGAAVELIHSYSLVHDDLPCMDDDAERRGVPAVHVAFGEAVAVLAGDALLAAAFEVLAKGSRDLAPERVVAALLELSRAAGSLALVGGQAEDLVLAQRLADHQARGVALRGRPVLHPEMVEVRSPTELVILSCSEPASDYGVYDIDSGERLPDEPPVREGQRDLQSAVMVIEDDLWKVSDLQGQVDFACEFAPTDRGLPSI